MRAFAAQPIGTSNPPHWWLDDCGWPGVERAGRTSRYCIEERRQALSKSNVARRSPSTKACCNTKISKKPSAKRKNHAHRFVRCRRDGTDIVQRACHPRLLLLLLLRGSVVRRGKPGLQHRQGKLQHA